MSSNAGKPESIINDPNFEKDDSLNFHDDKALEIEQLLSTFDSEENGTNINSIDLDEILKNAGLSSQTKLPNSLKESEIDENSQNTLESSNNISKKYLESLSQTQPENSQPDDSNYSITNEELQKIMIETQKALVGSLNYDNQQKTLDPGSQTPKASISATQSSLGSSMDIKSNKHLVPISKNIHPSNIQSSPIAIQRSISKEGRITFSDNSQRTIDTNRTPASSPSISKLSSQEIYSNNNLGNIVQNQNLKKPLNSPHNLTGTLPNTQLPQKGPAPGVPIHAYIANLMAQLPVNQRDLLSQSLVMLKSNQISTTTFLDRATSILGPELTKYLNFIVNNPAGTPQTLNQTNHHYTNHQSAQNKPELGSPNIQITPSNPNNIQNQIYRNSPLASPNYNSNTLSRDQSSEHIGLSNLNTSINNSGQNTINRNIVNLESQNKISGNNFKQPVSSSTSDSPSKIDNPHAALKKPIDQNDQTSLLLSALNSGAEGVYIGKTPAPKSPVVLVPSVDKKKILKISTASNMGSPKSNTTPSSSTIPNGIDNLNFSMVANHKDNKGIVVPNGLGNQNQTNSKVSGQDFNLKTPDTKLNSQKSTLERLELLVNDTRLTSDTLINLFKLISTHGEEIARWKEPESPNYTLDELKNRFYRVQMLRNIIVQRQANIQNHLLQRHNSQSMIISDTNVSGSHIQGEPQKGLLLSSPTSHFAGGGSLLDQSLKRLGKNKLSKTAKSGSELSNLVMDANALSILKSKKAKTLLKKQTKEGESLIPSILARNYDENRTSLSSYPSTENFTNSNINSINNQKLVSDAQLKHQKLQSKLSTASIADLLAGHKRAASGSTEPGKIGLGMNILTSPNQYRSTSEGKRPFTTDSAGTMNSGRLDRIEPPNKRYKQEMGMSSMTSGVADMNGDRSGSVVGNDKGGAASIDDVMGIAGVDLREETENILRSSLSQSFQDTRRDAFSSFGSGRMVNLYKTYSVQINDVEMMKDTRHRVEFLDERKLDSIISVAASQQGIKTVSSSVALYISQALQLRLRELLRSAISAAHHRVRTQTFPPPSLNQETNLPFYRIIPGFDVRKQLSALEKVDRNKERKYLELLLNPESFRSSGVSASGVSDKNESGLSVDQPGGGLEGTGNENESGTGLSSSTQGGDTSKTKPDGTSGRPTKYKRKRGGGVGNDSQSHLSSSTLSMAYAAVSGSGGSGSMLSARNMPEEVRSKITNQTALMSAGGVRKSWMMSGPLTSDWKPTPSPVSNSSSKIRQSQQKGYEAEHAGVSKMGTSAVYGEEGMDIDEVEINRQESQNSLYSFGVSKTAISSFENESMNISGMGGMNAPRFSENSSIAPRASSQSTDSPSISSANLAIRPRDQSQMSTNVGIGGNVTISKKKGGAISRVPSRQFDKSVAYSSTIGSPLGPYGGIQAGTPFVPSVRKIPVVVTLRDCLFCVEQERELSRKQLGQDGKGSDRNCFGMISGRDAVGAKTIVKAYATLLKD
ncbi:hypothetical protein BB558_004627 [Smittium angustum]|uniref:Transcription initiation factor TFIID subunit 4 n=1 Tax=Smittium angustum TaxID=133377 RepID=A0A2U1J2U8_SMIAN|nr:hypothetical protein BB558_004627 [Smittium angustum]